MTEGGREGEREGEQSTRQQLIDWLRSCIPNIPKHGFSHHKVLEMVQKESHYRSSIMAMCRKWHKYAHSIADSVETSVCMQGCHTALS